MPAKAGMELLTEKTGPEKDNSYGVEAAERFVLRAALIKQHKSVFRKRRSLRVMPF